MVGFSMEITENKSNGLQPAASFRSILASRYVDQLGPMTHLEPRHIQNFILRSMRPFDVLTYSTLRSIRRFDKFTISTVRDVNLSNLSTHIAFRTIRELGPFQILKCSRTQSIERRLQENNRELRSR
ncbi:hypothetical protein M513_12449 [Trichuris suis]|uniref:Uncharacterized protein n=1 Tax=Trichuris suis TaxID=68888 RepID=A0A085LNY5_9BILA|nr:hypothetical protein M513_12449 [Trichuris suis]